jgi:hypothetical protein
MTQIRIKDRRKESRVAADIGLVVWGLDTRGERFMQEARAREISLSGALLSGLEADLRSGDVVGLLYAGKKARFRVVWIRYDGGGDKMQVAVHRFSADECPWKEQLAVENDRSSPDSASAEP